MSEALTESPAPDVPIRDAACLLVADLSGAEPKLLMGKRHSNQVFLPNKWVFPGGRVEDDDRHFAQTFAGSFSPADLAHEIRPFVLAGIRELFEEAGLLIGSGATSPAPGPAWQAFAATGLTPAPSELFPLARAITPPGRVRRYDTWFFLADAAAISADQAETDGELLDLNWFTIADSGNLDLPNITRLVLNDVAAVLNAERALHDTAERVPFYYSDGSSFRRELISCKVAHLTP